MIKRRKTIILLIILAFIAIPVALFLHHLPPSSPIKRVQRSSGLRIPSTAEVLTIEDDYSFTGSGETYIVLRLDSISLDKFLKKNTFQGYSKLPITESLLGLPSALLHYHINLCKNNPDTVDVCEGYYKIEKWGDSQAQSFLIVIFDLKTSILYTYALYL